MSRYHAVLPLTDTPGSARDRGRAPSSVRSSAGASGITSTVHSAAPSRCGGATATTSRQAPDGSRHARNDRTASAAATSSPGRTRGAARPRPAVRSRSSGGRPASTPMKRTPRNGRPSANEHASAVATAIGSGLAHHPVGEAVPAAVLVGPRGSFRRAASARRERVRRVARAARRAPADERARRARRAARRSGRRSPSSAGTRAGTRAATRTPPPP